MSELKSKCCGAEIGYVFAYYHRKTLGYEHLKEHIKICEKCHKPTEIEEKDKPQDTAIYAGLRK